MFIEFSPAAECRVNFPLNEPHDLVNVDSLVDKYHVLCRVPLF